MPEKLIIIDGHYHCFKSFFALPAMSNSSGLQTNVIYGIAKLVNLLRKEGAEYIVFTFDSPGKTFRHDIYEEYKANREKAPDEFREQVPKVFDLLEAFNIPVLKHEGYEADDIIAFLAEKAGSSAKDIDILIESKDKDLYQILNDSVSLYSIADSTRFTPETLQEKWSIRPDQVKDFLQLVGDSSDNIPGIQGVGPKTASKLLGEFGSIEKIYEQIDSIKGKKKENLLAGKGNLEMTRKLVTLNLDIPMEIDLESLKTCEPDLEKVTQLYREFEFESLLKDLKPLASRSTEESEYILVDTPELFDRMINELNTAEVFAIDTETTGLDPHTDTILGISVSPEEGKGFYIPFPMEDTRLAEVIADPDKPMTGQNIKYDTKFFLNNGITPRGYIFDTMIASYLLDPGGAQRHNLSALADRHLGYRMIELSDITHKDETGQPDMKNVPVEKLSEYACEDADITLRLFNTLKPAVEKAGLADLLDTIEIPVAEILASMELNGIYLKTDLLEQMSVQLRDELDTLTGTIYELAGETFNINSPKQLGVILFDKLELPPVKKTKTGYSTNEQVLRQLSPMHPLPEHVLAVRKIEKLKNTYIDVLPGMVNSATGRIHPEFNQTVTATGRLSSSNPNLQNIPVRTAQSKEIRAAFTVSDPEHILLTADYSQIELRILAHFSEDPHLLETFRENKDIHKATAARLNGIDIEEVTDEMRTHAKTVNFGIIYGQGAYGLAGVTGMSNKEARDFIDRYFETFPGIHGFITRICSEAEESGEVRTILNRKRPVPEIRSSNKTKKRAGERVAVNTVIQGSAADLIKKAMVDIDSQLKTQNLEVKALLQIHDELLFELPQSELEEAKALIQNKMEKAMNLAVPLKVNLGFGNTWKEIH